MEGIEGVGKRAERRGENRSAVESNDHRFAIQIRSPGGSGVRRFSGERSGDSGVQNSERRRRRELKEKSIVRRGIWRGKNEADAGAKTVSGGTGRSTIRPERKAASENGRIFFEKKH